MQEYLTTTTLGDLSRKAREMNTTPEATESAIFGANTEATTSDIASVIRPALGEINQ